MAKLEWSPALDTSIDIIDKQHRRIVEMINQMDDALTTKDRKAVGEVIENLVDYTLSHFAFEESLMEDAGYEYVRAHKRVHELFVKRVSEYRMRFDGGEDVAEELNGMLCRWLFNHIKNDDAAYVGAVKGNMQVIVQDKAEGGWLSRSLKRFFG